MEKSIQKNSSVRRHARPNVKTVSSLRQVQSPTPTPTATPTTSPNSAQAQAQMDLHDERDQLRVQETSLQIRDSYDQTHHGRGTWKAPIFNIKKVKPDLNPTSLGTNKVSFRGQVLYPVSVYDMTRHDGTPFTVAKLLLKTWNPMTKTDDTGDSTLIPIQSAHIQVEMYDELAGFADRIFEKDYIEVYGSIKVTTSEKEIGGELKKIYYTALVAKTITKYMANDNSANTQTFTGLDNHTYF